MTDIITDLLKKRKEIKGKKPHFIRTDASFIKRLAKKWRRPTGRDNKVRRRKRGSLASPSYSSPRKVKDMHPRGLFEILVSNIDDLKTADNTKHAIRIRSAVGNKKKKDIVKKAKELKLHILNPGIKQKATIEKKQKDTKKINTPKKATEEVKVTKEEKSKEKTVTKKTTPKAKPIKEKKETTKKPKDNKKKTVKKTTHAQKPKKQTKK